ncbi:MAG: aminotransferase class III-fold pyridoxal phosphate-dependent enzyme [Alphaproteobacteria bacterium]|nr:aminotransferase class III-fold pyridoxal phosphate-dependent enzyme [Alphaproteobacteria bacterium]
MTGDDSLEAIDRHGLLHPFTNLRGHAEGTLGGPRIITGGQGVRITDQHGKTYIDGFAGLYCVNIGYGRTEVAEAIYEQAKKLAYYHAYAGHSNEPAIRLTGRLLRMAPGKMSKVFYGLSGSDANETQVKLVWYYNNALGRPEKKKIISRHRGYHGGSVMSGSLTGLPVFHQAFDLPVKPVLHTSTPHYYWQHEPGESEAGFARRCADELEAMILAEGPETVAAFIGEPVLGTGGIIPPPAGYWPAIQAVLKKYDVLMIADEVVCGFGRIGTDFGCQAYGIEPDMVTVAKGLTSAYAPLSAALVSEPVWEVLQQGSDKLGTFAHGYTYSAHPIGAAAALANLDIVEGEDLAGNARDTGGYLQERLQAAFADHPLVGEVRGIGLLAAIEFVADKPSKTRFDPGLKVGAKVSAACLEEGLIARAMPHGDILGFAPPLVISRADVDDVVARTERAIARVTETLAKEGVLTAA